MSTLWEILTWIPYLLPPIMWNCLVPWAFSISPFSYIYYLAFNHHTKKHSLTSFFCIKTQKAIISNLICFEQWLESLMNAWKFSHNFLTLFRFLSLSFLLLRSRIPQCLSLGNLIRPQVWGSMEDQKMYDMLERSRLQIDCCCSKGWQMWEREQVPPCAVGSESAIKVSLCSLTSAEGI